MEEEKIKKFVLILILSLSITSIPMFASPPAHASVNCASYLIYEADKIEGCVVNSDTGNPVSGMDVYIVACGFLLTWMNTTDSNGHFLFRLYAPNGQPCFPNGNYPVSINGVTPPTAQSCPFAQCHILGDTADDPTWGQWVGDISADGNGYGSLGTIYLTPARRVMVVASALYSETQFTTLHFSMSQSAGIEESISVSIGGASSIQGGFSNNFQVTSANAFDEPATHSEIFAYPYYGVGFYCAGSQAINLYWSCNTGLQTVGVTAPIPGYHWQPYQTGEYLNPNSLSGSYLDCTINPAAGTFGPSSTTTQGLSSSIGYTSTATFFGITVSLSYSTTFTTSSSNTTGVTISYTNGPAIKLRYYPATGSCQNPIFGAELHVWDMSTPPDFSVSPSPSSLSEQQGSAWIDSSTINVQASWGWALPISMTANSNDPNLHLSLNPTSVNPYGASTSTTLTVTDLKASDCGSYNMWVYGQSGSTVRYAVIPVYIAPTDFCIFADNNAIDVAYSQGYSPTITITSKAAANIALSASVSPGFTAGFGQPNLSVPAGGTASTSVYFTPSSSLFAGTYNANITATSGSIAHTIHITINYVGDFGISPSSLTIYPTPGSTTALGLTAFSDQGFSGYIYFYQQSTGGISASIYSNPMLLLASYFTSSTSMSVYVPSTTPLGTYTLTIQGTFYGPNGYAVNHYTTITVNVSSSSGGGGGGGGGGGPPKPTIHVAGSKPSFPPSSD